MTAMRRNSAAGLLRVVSGDVEAAHISVPRVSGRVSVIQRALNQWGRVRRHL